MWSRRRLAEDDAGARAAGIPEGGVVEGALQQRASKAIAGVRPARDKAPDAASMAETRSPRLAGIPAKSAGP